MSKNTIKLRQVVSRARPFLKAKNFREYKESGWSSIFCKQLDNGLFLTIGFEMSYLYYDTWTASLYLGTTTMIGVTWPDIPFMCYERAFNLLSISERMALGFPSTNDYWWTSLSEETLQSFLKVLDIAIKKMEADDELIKKINESNQSAVLKARVKQVTENYINLSRNDSLPNHSKKKEENMEIWKQASNLALSEEGINTADKVIFYANLACRQYDLTNSETK